MRHTKLVSRQINEKFFALSVRRTHGRAGIPETFNNPILHMHIDRIKVNKQINNNGEENCKFSRILCPKALPLRSLSCPELARLHPSSRYTY